MMKKLFLLFLAGIVFAGKACDINFAEASWDNWRVLVVVALGISALIIAGMYMIASAFQHQDTILHLRSEIFQIAATAVISILFISAIAIICSPVIPGLFGYQNENFLDISENYLKSAVKWTKDAFWMSYEWLSFLHWYESFGGRSPLLRGTGRALQSLFATSLLNLFSLSHISAYLHLHLLKFVQPYALTFLIPLGIVVRAAYPFRRFGGALIGVGLGLVVIFPLLIVLNSVVMGTYFNETILLPNISCSDNRMCESRVCNATSFKCGEMLGKGESCPYPSLVPPQVTLIQPPTYQAQIIPNVPGDWQCVSGRCSDGKCADTDSLKVEGSSCTKDGDCMPSLWCDGFNCKPALKADISGCGRNEQCGAPGTGYCDKDKICRFAKIVGVGCDEDVECASLYCEGVAPNKVCTEVKITERQILYEIGGAGTVGRNIFSIFDFKKLFTGIFEKLAIAIVGGMLLPLINYLLLGRAIKDFSAFFGAELDISSIYRIL